MWARSARDVCVLVVSIMRVAGPAVHAGGAAHASGEVWHHPSRHRLGEEAGLRRRGICGSRVSGVCAASQARLGWAARSDRHLSPPGQRRAVAMETLLKMSWADPQASDAAPRGNQQPQVQWFDLDSPRLPFGIDLDPPPPPPLPRQPTAAPAPEPVPSDDFEARVLANMRKTQEIRRQLAVCRMSSPCLATYAPTVARL
jgi:hypothetical protein